MNKISFCQSMPKPFAPRDRVCVYIDGNQCRTYDGYLTIMFEQLNMPKYNIAHSSYMDWMRDLSWIKNKHIVIIIENYDKFLSQRPEDKQYFIDDFQDIIFPFWENDAQEVFEDDVLIKSIYVYCLNRDDRTK